MNKCSVIVYFLHTQLYANKFNALKEKNKKKNPNPSEVETAYTLLEW